MRIALGILVTLLVSLGTGGGVRPQNDRPRATSSQSSPSAQPVCDIQDATDCRVSKGKKQFIWWEAPPDEARHVAFPHPLCSALTILTSSGPSQELRTDRRFPSDRNGVSIYHKRGPM